MADRSLIERLTKMHEAALAKRYAGSAMVSFRPAEAIELAFDAMTEIESLRAAVQEACDLLAERTHGNSARSPGHNARLVLETAMHGAPAFTIKSSGGDHG